MSNYNPLVAYGPKDLLANLDPNKLIKGTQIDAELNAIATAVSSKLDIATTNLSITSISGANAITATGNVTTGASFGIGVVAGTNSSDYGLNVNNRSGTGLFRVRGDGTLLAGLVDFTPTQGTFTATLTGCTTAPTGTANYYKVGPLVTIALPALSATSNANTFTMTGLPANLQAPTVNQFTAIAQDIVRDNGLATGTWSSVGIFTGSGTITFVRNGSSSGWTNSGTKGLSNVCIIQYLII